MSLESTPGTVALVPGKPVVVLVTREPFCDWFIIKLPNGYTEELEAEETQRWFKDHGANPIAIERFLDHVWNFRRGEVEIQCYKEPKTANPKTDPNL